MGVMKKLSTLKGKTAVMPKKGEKITPRAGSAKNVLVSLFKSSASMSDEKILEKLNQTTGKKFTLDKVKRHRARFNSKGKK